MNANDSLDLDEDLDQVGVGQNMQNNYIKMDSSIPDFKDFNDFKISNEIYPENINIKRNEEQNNLGNGDYHQLEEENEELDQAIIIENPNNKFQKENTLNDNQILVGIEEEEIKDGCNGCGGCQLI